MLAQATRRGAAAIGFYTMNGAKRLWAPPYSWDAFALRKDTNARNCRKRSRVNTARGFRKAVQELCSLALLFQLTGQRNLIEDDVN